MIDTSIFFRRKMIFWSWIFAPLAIRVLIMLVLSAAARGPEAALRREAALAAAVPLLTNAIHTTQAELDYFTNQKLSSKERFLTDAADLLYRTGVQGHTQITEKEGPTGSSLKKYLFRITGSAPTLYDLSRFLNEAEQLDYLRISSGKISERTGKTETVYEFSLTFERVEFNSGAAL